MWNPFLLYHSLPRYIHVQCLHVHVWPLTYLNCVYKDIYVYFPEDQSAETVMQLMDHQYAPLHLVSMVTKHGTPQQLGNAKDSDLLTKERLCRALSMFEVVLKRFRDILLKDKEVMPHPMIQWSISVNFTRFSPFSLELLPIPSFFMIISFTLHTCTLSCSWCAHFMVAVMDGPSTSERCDECRWVRGVLSPVECHSVCLLHSGSTRTHHHWVRLHAFHIRKPCSWIALHTWLCTKFPDSETWIIHVWLCWTYNVKMWCTCTCTCKCTCMCSAGYVML